jgi:dipeptidase E
MKLLLTSAGITNPSIRKALLGLLGKPIAECNALCIPTANYAQRNGAANAWRFASGNEPRTPMVELGWKSMGLLELTALPSVNKEYWEPMVRETDVILVNGGDPMFLYYWMQQSGFAELLPSLRPEAVYVGLSAGSMVLTPNIGTEFVNWEHPNGNAETLGLVDFAIFPHLDHPDLPDNIMPTAEKWAANLRTPAYAIDDNTAIQVVDGAIEVISEGQWHYFPREE